MYPHTCTPRRLLLGALMAIALAALPVAPAAAATWASHSLALPSGYTQTRLYAISCTSILSINCTATGQDYNGTWGAHATTGAGASWNPQVVTRNPGNKNGVFNGVSCVDASVCLAAGGYGRASGAAPLGMTQVQGGGGWSTVHTDSASEQLTYNAASCLPTSSPPLGLEWCMFVGYNMVSRDDKPFARSYPSYFDEMAATASNATLLGVSCLAGKLCMAVGSTGGSALAEWFDVGATPRFRILTTPPLPFPGTGTNAKLNAVTCRSTTWCLAVGRYQNTSGATMPYSSVWNGTSWTSQTMPLPSGSTQGTAYGVSCVSTTDCQAVGEASPGMTPFADSGLTTSGFTTSTAVPVPSGATGATLRGVSCTSAVRCEAAGWSVVGGNPVDLIESFS